MPPQGCAKVGRTSLSTAAPSCIRRGISFSAAAAAVLSPPRSHTFVVAQPLSLGAARGGRLGWLGRVRGLCHVMAGGPACATQGGSLHHTGWQPQTQGDSPQHKRCEPLSVADAGGGIS